MKLWWLTVLAVAVLVAPVYGQSPGGSPSLLTAPSIAEVGQSVTFSGSGWDQESSVSAYFGRSERDAEAEPFLSAETDMEGSFSEEVVVPPRPGGEFELFACQPCFPDEFSDTKEAVAGFAILRTFLLTPENQQVGNLVRALGEAWDPRAGPISLYLSAADRDQKISPVASVAPLDTGHFETEFLVPERDPGGYKALACQRCDALSRAIEEIASFEIEPIPITSSPAEPSPSVERSETTQAAEANKPSETNSRTRFALSSLAGISDRGLSLLLNLGVTLLGLAIFLRSPLSRAIVSEVLRHPLRRVTIRIANGQFKPDLSR